MKQKGKKKKKKKNEKTGERLACVIVIEAVMDGRWMMIRYGLEELCSEELYGQRRDRPSLNSFLEAGLQTGSFLFLLFSGSGCLSSSSFYYYDYIFLFCFVSFWKMWNCQFIVAVPSYGVLKKKHWMNRMEKWRRREKILIIVIFYSVACDSIAAAQRASSSICKCAIDDDDDDDDERLLFFFSSLLSSCSSPTLLDSTTNLNDFISIWRRPPPHFLRDAAANNNNTVQLINQGLFPRSPNFCCNHSRAFPALIESGSALLRKRTGPAAIAAGWRWISLR